MIIYTHNSSDTKCVGIFHTYNSLTLWSPAGCLIIQFNSDTNYLEWAQSPRVKGSVPQDCPTPISDASHKSQAACTSDWQAVNCRFPWSLPRVQQFARTQEALHLLLLDYCEGHSSGTSNESDVQGHLSWLWGHGGSRPSLSTHSPIISVHSQFGNSLSLVF